MEELKIYQYQAKEIEDTLRIVANVLNSRSRETALDRQVMKAYEMIEKVLAKKP
ncbi:hypothetical protein IC229_33275 [Spirosoma sp. BT702]|uniref:Uncharacterized protein n=1 Tax=Spirosoma profusum TaxID=2771354 RepID=A0A927AW33_9BACT|nr:hypothetical protein [Spirosoma profusum]MBD2705528.1 hypothetical protein [Spirosoma profusum]